MTPLDWKSQVVMVILSPASSSGQLPPNLVIQHIVYRAISKLGLAPIKIELIDLW